MGQVNYGLSAAGVRVLDRGPLPLSLPKDSNASNQLAFQPVWPSGCDIELVIGLLA